MGRKKKLEPRYLEHKQSGRGRAVYYDSRGGYHDVLLPGPFNSPESTAAYGRLLIDLAVQPKGAAIPAAERESLPLVEVLDAFHQYAERRYRGPDGRPTSKLTEYRLAIRKCRELFGDLPAREFSPLRLKAAQQAWVADGLSRPECNRRVGMVKRIVKWAVAEELVPATVVTALSTVAGLERGQTAAKDPEPIGPVDDATVDATLPFLNRQVRGLIQFMRLTGCRPGEACMLRRCDIDTSREVWLYRPPHHKTAWRGKARTIAIGPKAQAVLQPFIGADPTACFFSPARATEEMHAARNAGRTTPLYPSHKKHNARRRAKLPKRRPAERYTAHAVAVAVARACDRAFPVPEELAPREVGGKLESQRAWWARLTPGEKQRVREWRESHRWHPNQLRHTFATNVRRLHGLEAAQVLLGHSRADITQIYAERDEAAAVRVAAQVG